MGSIINPKLARFIIRAIRPWIPNATFRILPATQFEAERVVMEEAERVRRIVVAGQTWLAEKNAWNDVLDRHWHDMLAPRGMYNVLCGTPKVLQKCGAEDFPIMISEGVLRRVDKKPEILALELRGVQAGIGDPLAVFKSRTRKNSIVVLTKISSTQNAVVVVVVSLGTRGSGGRKINKISSIHLRPPDQIENFIESGLTLYINTEKTRDYLRSGGLQLPTEASIHGKILTEKDFTHDELDRNRVKKNLEKRPPRTIPEVSEIISRANRGRKTYLEAPNRRPTNLTEFQWIRVRTNAFKEWFGDWEHAAQVAKLRDSHPICSTGKEWKQEYNLKTLKTSEYNPKTGKCTLNRGPANDYVLKTLCREGVYTNKDTGSKILVTKNKRTKVTSHDELRLKVLPLLPRIIENSIYLGEKTNFKKKNKFDTFRYYAVGLKFGKEDYTVRLTTGVKYGEKCYDFSVIKKEKGDLISRIDPLKCMVYRWQDPPPECKLDRLFFLLQTNFSKIVDENGEPRVVYRQTTERAGDLDGGKTQNGSESQMSFFEQTYDDEHPSYGNKTIEHFLNIKSPKVNPKITGRDMSAEMVPEALGKDAWDAYDGFIWEEKDRRRYAVFRPDQVKSATGNIGTLDGGNTDVRFLRACWIKQAGNVSAWFNPTICEIVLREGCDAGVVLEEVCWYAFLYFAMRRMPKIYAKMLRCMQNAPRRAKSIVEELYPDLEATQEVWLDKFGSMLFGRGDVSKIKKLCDTDEERAWMKNLQKLFFKGRSAMEGAIRETCNISIEAIPELPPKKAMETTAGLLASMQWLLQGIIVDIDELRR